MSAMNEDGSAKCYRCSGQPETADVVGLSKRTVNSESGESFWFSCLRCRTCGPASPDKEDAKSGWNNIQFALQAYFPAPVRKPDAFDRWAERYEAGE